VLLCNITQLATGKLKCLCSAVLPICIFILSQVWCFSIQAVKQCRSFH